MLVLFGGRCCPVVLHYPDAKNRPFSSYLTEVAGGHPFTRDPVWCRHSMETCITAKEFFGVLYVSVGQCVVWQSLGVAMAMCCQPCCQVMLL